MSETEIVSVLEKNGYEIAQIEQWISNNQQLIDMIDINIPLHQLLFPAYESPDEIKELYAKFSQQTA